MAKNFKGGFIGGFDQLRAPNAPTISVTADNTELEVTFTNPSDVGGGAISSYTATAIASGVSTGVTSATSPVTITGLTNDTSYSVTGLANNAFGSSPYSAASSATPISPRGLIMGGVLSGSPYRTNRIQYITLASTGNATDFGDLLATTRSGAGLSSATRGIFGGGIDSARLNVIQYVSINSTGNASDFGDLSADKKDITGLSSSTRGIFSGGQIP
jgi:hypothetical protein